MADPTIKLNPAKPSELEFDVSVQGTDDGAPPIVRFVMSLDAAYDCVFPCHKMDGVKWQAKLPALTDTKLSTVPFKIEVIVDGYFFEPAQGTVILVTDPSIKITPAVSKPSVTTSFTVRQDPPGKSEEDEQVGMPVAQYGGELSPTNQLLRPEFDPAREQGNVKIGNASVYDQLVDKTKIEDISSSVTPGETTDPEPQHGNNVADEGDEEIFDPRRVAETIVHQTLGAGMIKPEKPGTLFKRDRSGKAVIDGIESPEVRAAKAKKAQRVRDILNPLS